MGTSAGQSTQGSDAIAVGSSAENVSQGSYAVTMGTLAGKSTQGSNAIAVGSSAENSSQLLYSFSVFVSIVFYLRHFFIL